MNENTEERLRLLGAEGLELSLKIIQDLTKKDFPESQLSIDDSGIISYLQN